MSSMKNPAGDPPGGQSRSRQQRKRGGTSDGNEAFLLAFVDALRDILRDESRPLA